MLISLVNKCDFQFEGPCKCIMEFHVLTGDYLFSVKGPTTGGFSIITKVNKAGKKLDSDVTVKSSALTVVSKFNADYAAKSYNFDASVSLR